MLGCSSGQFHPTPSSCTLLGTNQDAAPYEPPASKLKVSPCLGWVMELQERQNARGRVGSSVGLKELTWPGLWDPTLSVLCPGCLPSHSCPHTSSSSSCWGKQSLLPPASGRWRGSRLCSMKALWELGLLLALEMQGFFPPGSRRSGRRGTASQCWALLTVLQVFPITSGTLARKWVLIGGCPLLSPTRPWKV